MNRFLLIGLLVVGLQTFVSCIEDPTESRETTSIENYLVTRPDASEFNITDSGLFYRIVDEGDGEFVTDTSVVVVSNVLLQGLDNKIFYSSDQFGPWHRKFQESVILTQGMLEAYQLIPIGGEVEVIIPHELAYGEEGFLENQIQPFENLRMEIEHLRVKLTPEEYIADEGLGEFELTDEGLYYQIDEMNQGTGDLPRDGQTVEIEYVGRFFTGEVFDQSGEVDPFDFEVGGGFTIQGWEVGIPLFKNGAEGILIVPYELAYGEDGTLDGRIPPFESLRFDIKVVDIN